MIFVTVGTHHQPFQRLLAGLSSLPQDELVVQHGPAPAPRGVSRAEAYMPFEEMLTCYRRADVVITHAGVGSILCARREGHVPLVVPRRHDLGEHVDDHQAELTRALEANGSVIAVWDIDTLASQVATAPKRQSDIQLVEPSMCDAVRAALEGSARSN